MQQKNLSNFVHFTFWSSLSFALLTITSHPKSVVNKKIPHVKIKNVSVLPSIKVSRNDKLYHIHHWLYLSSFYLPLLIFKRNKFKSKVFHGLVIGGIMQGLFYKDRFHIIHKAF